MIGVYLIEFVVLQTFAIKASSQDKIVRMKKLHLVLEKFDFAKALQLKVLVAILLSFENLTPRR